MPNGHSRNRNSRHANTQRNIRQAEIISAQSIEIINDVIVEAEAFVDHSAEHRAETLALKKRLDKLEKKERETSEENREYRRCLDDLHERKIITLTEHEESLAVEFNSITLENGKTIEFKNVAEIINISREAMLTGQRQLDIKDLENKKLREFCKTLLEKNESDKKLVEKCRKELQRQASNLLMKSKVKENKSSEPGWKFFKEDDDLVCDINFSDEEDDN